MHRHRLISMAAAAFGLACNATIFAATGADTWTGATNSMNTAGNWTGVNPPPISGDSWVFGAAGAGGTNLNNNLTTGASWSVAAITFNSGASAFVIGDGTTNANVGGTFTLAGNVTDNALSLETINDAFAMTAVRTFTIASSGKLTLGGIISGSTGGILDTQGGTLTLAGADTYGGATSVWAGGTLQVTGTISGTSGVTAQNGTFIDGDTVTASNNTGVTNRVKSTSSLTLNNGTFHLAASPAAGTYAQTFAALSLGAGFSTINTNAATGANTLTFSNAATSNYTRVTASLLEIDTQSGFNVAFTNAPTTTAIGSGADAILLGATLNGTSFIKAAAGNVAAASYTATGGTTWTAGKNMDVTGSNATPYTAAAVNSVRFNQAAPDTITLASGVNTIGGGILLTSNVGNNASLITGGAINASSGKDLIIIQNNGTAATTGLTIASAIADNGSSSLAKFGSGYLTLSGLSATAANNYAGTTYIDGGTLAISTQNASLTGGLTFPAAAGAPRAITFNLNSSATFGGAMVVQSNSSTANVINIDQNLTTSGNVTIGCNSVNTSTTTKLTVNGSGSWNIGSGSGQNVQIGNGSGTAFFNVATVDVRGLASFSANLGSAGLFRIGDNTGFSGGSPDVVYLAPSSTITAGTIGVGDASGFSVVHQLVLGTGDQFLNANTLNIGQAAGGRSGGILQFDTPGSGTLQVRAQDTVSAAALNIITTTTSTGALPVGTFDVSGHHADLLFSTINMTDISGVAGGTPGAAYSSRFTFDTGTLVATTIKLGTRESVSTLPQTQTATMFIGETAANGDSINASNTATLGAVNMATQNSAFGGISAALNIGGSATTVGITSLNVANNTASVGGTATGAVNISDGNTTLTNGIVLAQSTGGAVTGSLTLTGGTLKLGTGGISTSISGGAAANTTLTVDGGKLDLNNHAIGDAGQLISNLNFKSGTLQNVLEINNGATLVKTATSSGNPLVLTGVNQYTGGTAVNAGTLLANSTDTVHGSTGPGSIIVGDGTANSATLGGAGYIVLGSSNSITIASNASIAPGLPSSTGSKLTIAGGAGVNFGGSNTGIFAVKTADAGVNDSLVLTGAATLDLGSAATLAVTATDASAGNTYTIATWESGPNNGVFNTVMLNSNSESLLGTTTAGTSVTYNYTDMSVTYNDPSSGAGSIQLTINSVPEPASMALLGLGMAGLLARRRRHA